MQVHNQYEFKYAPGDKITGSGFLESEIEYLVVTENGRFYCIQDDDYDAESIESDSDISK